ncbi:hypothetical protein V6N13_039059 [Hibiscus sabdariffa]|uniref:Prolamin-like domain-containing protein n=1 Tax=Hibiscus sabdariffa TaxID=183260 RepID=A0ABR2SWV8_9ROSI
MSKGAETTICWLLLATCTAVLIRPRLAVAQLPQPGSPPDVRQCWSAVFNVKGCMWEIYRSFFTAEVGSIGPGCCKAFTTINENCWPKMFPVNPSFPTLLKDHCAHFPDDSPKSNF